MKIILCAGISVRSGTNYMASIFSDIQGIESIPPEASNGEFGFFRPKRFKALQQSFDDFNKSMCTKNNLKEGLFRETTGQSFIELLKKNYNISSDTIFVKDPKFYNIETFFDFFPEGKLILLTRDARDQLSSSFKSALLVRKSQPLIKKVKAYVRQHSGYNMVVYSRAYIRHAQQLELLRKELKGKFVEVKYEDLVVNPQETISAVFKHCDVPFDNDVLAKAMNAKVVGSSFYGAKTSTPNWKPMDKNKEFNPIGRHKKWGLYNRIVYRLLTKKANQSVGYDLD